ncbi:uncharacterized protein K460DRAFT_412901 [Cucurbitaria berberidis CBS 394.84]|uniref:DUF8021 domain-containing protein n=1 Tax=Cucurbitaria berberidis CBS 394.84 TaxID=1168544 RepID=A0A9P4GT92_9PLEO|nr:uncharacterized protein K460DRAFT_412901 [Cucurbitaria berberidis CBS 394.84]KAF1851325.1 hypothetical protein K460DRAFT_412901 [Cucurbitaria berberidis CBS 394.84]
MVLLALSAAHCTRPQLAEAVDSYLSTQTTGQTSTFKERFDNSTWLGYYENGRNLDINSGILNTPLPITHNRTIYDTTSCATYTEVIVNSTANPHVIGTQLRFTNDKINKIDTIVTKPGDWLFNITGYAYWVEQENWSTIPEAGRDTRATIKAAADAYCDVFSNSSVTVPWGTPCVRLEGGLYGDAGPNGTCSGFIPTGVPITNRRYVIDETVGTVDIISDFGKSKWPDTHEFRVEGGKLRYVHTMTHCGVPNCGVKKRGIS